MMGLAQAAEGEDRKPAATAPRGKARLARRAAEVAVAAAFDVEMGSLRVATRGPARAAFARQTAMYLAHVVGGLSLTDVGRAFERDRTTVAHACGLVEDRRDEPEFDRRLNHLEDAVAALIAAQEAGPR